MGLYNMVFGNSQQAPLVLAVLGMTPSDVGRFRDAWFEKTADGGLRCAVYTRNGGGNREHSSDDKEPGPECGCTGCTIEHKLPAHPLYLGDKDDDFDSTYAMVYFRLPAELPAALVEMLPDDLKTRSALVAKIGEIAQDPPDMSDRWQKAIDAIGKPASRR